MMLKEINYVPTLTKVSSRIIYFKVLRKYNEFTDCTKKSYKPYKI